MQKKVLKSSITITNGCGRGKSCRVDLYVQPYSSTRDQFTKYADEAIKRLKEDNKNN